MRHYVLPFIVLAGFTAHSEIANTGKPCWRNLSIDDVAEFERASLRKIHDGTEEYGFQTVGVHKTDNGPYYIIEYTKSGPFFPANDSRDDRFYSRIPGTRRERVAAPETLNKVLGLDQTTSRFRFAAVEKEEIPKPEFIDYIANDQWPISVQGYTFLHDVHAHASVVYQFAMTDRKTWNRLVKVAGVLNSNHAKYAQEISSLVGFLDTVSAGAGQLNQVALYLKLKSDLSDPIAKMLDSIEKAIASAKY